MMKSKQGTFSAFVMLFNLNPALAFSSLIQNPSLHRSYHYHHRKASSLWVSRDEVVQRVNSAYDDDMFRGAEFLEFSLALHRPLGCSIEESMALSCESRYQHVFVSKVTVGGYAEQAGLRTGDVLLGVSGIFGDLETVVNLGIDRM
jgi:hypothetical protein